MERGARGGGIGFWTGAAAPFEGLRFVATTPSLWPLAAVPVTIACALVALLGWAALAGSSALVASLLGAPLSIYGRIGAVALRIALAAAGVLVAFVVALSLAQPLSGPALDRIASSRERALGAGEPRSVSTIAAVLRSVRTSTFALVLGLSVLGLIALVDAVVPAAAVVTVPLGFVVSGLLVAWDMLDPSLGARDLGVRARLAFFRLHFSAVLGFALALAVLLLVPCAGLLLLPAGVAGAAGLVVRTEQARRASANADLEVGTT
jgi:CysZ protein